MSKLRRGQASLAKFGCLNGKPGLIDNGSIAIFCFSFQCLGRTQPKSSTLDSEGWAQKQFGIHSHHDGHRTEAGSCPAAHVEVGGTS